MREYVLRDYIAFIDTGVSNYFGVLAALLSLGVVFCCLFVWLVGWCF